MRKGKTTASAINATAARRDIATSGDDSRIAGTNVIAPIDHIDSIATVSDRAINTANTNGAANATTGVRRNRSVGHNVSQIAAKVGCAARRLSTIGATTYARLLGTKMIADSNADESLPECASIA